MYIDSQRISALCIFVAVTGLGNFGCRHKAGPSEQHTRSTKFSTSGKSHITASLFAKQNNSIWIRLTNKSTRAVSVINVQHAYRLQFYDKSGSLLSFETPGSVVNERAISWRDMISLGVGKSIEISLPVCSPEEAVRAECTAGNFDLWRSPNVLRNMKGPIAEPESVNILTRTKGGNGHWH